jgi:hypothetical protein
MSNCESHPFEEAADTCRSCTMDFCSDCLVYSYGASKPPYCIPCALAASGVRKTAGRGGGGRRNVAARMVVALAVVGGAGAAAVPVASALGVG